MLTIRFQRVGKKKQPVFRIVLAEKHRSAKKLAQEILGHYNPQTKEFGVKDEGRLKYWIEQHVEMSPSVHNLLVSKGLLEGKKVRAWRPKRKSEESKTASPEKVEAKSEVASEEKKLISNS
jgi:small subunit ribosomal protein S16